MERKRREATATTSYLAVLHDPIGTSVIRLSVPSIDDSRFVVSAAQALARKESHRVVPDQARSLHAVIDELAAILAE
jgi:hypothetical protein